MNTDSCLILKDVPPTSFIRDHPHQQEVVPSFQEAVASGATEDPHQAEGGHDGNDTVLNMSEWFFYFHSQLRML